MTVKKKCGDNCCFHLQWWIGLPLCLSICIAIYCVSIWYRVNDLWISSDGCHIIGPVKLGRYHANISLPECPDKIFENWPVDIQENSTDIIPCVYQYDCENIRVKELSIDNTVTIIWLTIWSYYLCTCGWGLISWLITTIWVDCCDPKTRWFLRHQQQRDVELQPVPPLQFYPSDEDDDDDDEDDEIWSSS